MIMVAALLTVVLGTSGLLPGAASLTPARADTAPPTGDPQVKTFSADPLPTVQIDGVAWSQVVVGNVVYVTGNFTSARPAGASPGSAGQVARSNLLAYDLTTGNLITGFDHTLNAQGRIITASPDGSRVYVGGNFTTVDGHARNHVAAFDTATGALDTGFAPATNSTVLAIAATDSSVYLGGLFSTVNGSGRARLAAVTASGGLSTWNPGADNAVTSLVVAPDGSRVIVGGTFAALAGQPRYGIGSVLTDQGTAGPWPADFPVRAYGGSSAVDGLTASGSVVYGAAYSSGSGNFEGRFAVEPDSGTLIWLNSCHGDSYSVAVLNNVLYSASHEHDCSDIGSFTQDAIGVFPSDHRYVEAETLNATGTIRPTMFDSATGFADGGAYASFAGLPHSTQLHFYPSLTVGSATGQSQAAWSVTGNANYLAVGGEFPTADGVAQQGLVRYAVSSIAANKIGPTTPPAPAVIAQGSGSLRVSWPASWDQDNTQLRYAVYRDGGATPVFTTTVGGSFWQRRMLGFADIGLSSASSHRYRISASDPFGNTTAGPTSAPVPAHSSSGLSSAAEAYSTMIRDDGATDYWPLSQDSGTTAVSATGFDDLSTRAGLSWGAAGPIPDGGTAATLNGTVNGTGLSGGSDSVASATSVTAPLAESAAGYTVEAWVKTTSTQGGTVLADGSLPAADPKTRATQFSPAADRVLYLDDDGRIAFGVLSGNHNATVVSKPGFNDGRWHHLVATSGSGGTTLWVDGTAVANSPTMIDQDVFWGYWRIGAEQLTKWTPTPSSPALAGSVADVAVYPTQLDADRIDAHYAASGQPPAAAPPTTPPPGEQTETPFALDTFDRTTSSGWGEADQGGPWATSPASAFAVSPGAGSTTGSGTIRLSAGATSTAYLTSVSSTSTDLTSTIRLDKLPTRSVYLDLIGRRVGLDREYDGLVRINQAGRVYLDPRKLDGTSSVADLAAPTTTGTYPSGSKLHVRLQVSGTSPTTVRMKAWPAGSSEPTAWAVSATDNSTDLQADGAVGFRSYLSSGDTSGPITLAVSDLAARPVG